MKLKPFSLIMTIALVFACTSCSDDTEHAFAPDDDTEQTQPDPTNAHDPGTSPETGTEPDDSEGKTDNPNANKPDDPNANKPDDPTSGSIDPQPLPEVSRLGGQTPEDALEYMKSTPNLVIVQVTPEEYKLEVGFIGALYIPYTELETRYDEIPSDVPVILHCRRGKASVPAYEILCEKRPDIPELSYIAGEPLVEEYNAWYEAISN